MPNPFGALHVSDDEEEVKKGLLNGPFSSTVFVVVSDQKCSTDVCMSAVDMHMHEITWLLGSRAFAVAPAAAAAKDAAPAKKAASSNKAANNTAAVSKSRSVGTPLPR